MPRAAVAAAAKGAAVASSVALIVFIVAVALVTTPAQGATVRTGTVGYVCLLLDAARLADTGATLRHAATARYAAAGHANVGLRVFHSADTASLSAAGACDAYVASSTLTALASHVASPFNFLPRRLTIGYGVSASDAPASYPPTDPSPALAASANTVATIELAPTDVALGAAMADTARYYLVKKFAVVVIAPPNTALVSAAAASAVAAGIAGRAVENGQSIELTVVFAPTATHANASALAASAVSRLASANVKWVLLAYQLSDDDSDAGQQGNAETTSALDALVSAGLFDTHTVVLPRAACRGDNASATATAGVANVTAAVATAAAARVAAFEGQLCVRPAFTNASVTDVTDAALATAGTPPVASPADVAAVDAAVLSTIMAASALAPTPYAATALANGNLTTVAGAGRIVAASARPRDPRNAYAADALALAIASVAAANTAGDASTNLPAMRAHAVATSAVLGNATASALFPVSLFEPASGATLAVDATTGRRHADATFFHVLNLLRVDDSSSSASSASTTAASATTNATYGWHVVATAAATAQFAFDATHVADAPDAEFHQRVNLTTPAIFGKGASASTAVPAEALTETTERLPAFAIAIGVIFPAAVIVGVLILSFKRPERERDNSAAPTDESKPISCVFTDVEKSTVLWEAMPDEMGAVIDAHHELFRRLIADHNGYEVKTVGDAFFVVFADPDDAVRFAVASQYEMEAVEWPANLAAVYHSAYEERGDDFDDFGLRVRVAMHCGRCEIKEESGGYDYYGPVVNAASRLEGVAKGGQICLSDEMLAMVVKDASLFSTSPLGTFTLKGIEAPVAVSALVPVGHEGRKLAGKTRLEMNAENGDGELPAGAGSLLSADVVSLGDTSALSERAAGGTEAVGELAVTLPSVSKLFSLTKEDPKVLNAVRAVNRAWRTSSSATPIEGFALALNRAERAVAHQMRMERKRRGETDGDSTTVGGSQRRGSVHLLAISTRGRSQRRQTLYLSSAGSVESPAMSWNPPTAGAASLPGATDEG